MNPRIRKWALAIAATCAATACGDRLSTEPPVTSSLESTAARSDAVVGLLKRTRPLKEAMSASRVIGPKGGKILLPQAGVRIDFARGAVMVPTRITITALKGDNVAYTFEPHGLVFAAPLPLTQSLKETPAWKTHLAEELRGSYFERLVVDSTGTYAQSRERRPTRLKDAKEVLEFSIEHFSGYMVSTGDLPLDIKVDVKIDITSR